MHINHQVHLPSQQPAQAGEIKEFTDRRGPSQVAMNYQRLIESGVAQWNQWRSQHPHQLPDLRGINLTHSYLFEINLMGSDLRGVDLRRACLIGANLSRANLSGANLGGAYLSEANLREANLSNANLIDTQMANVDLLRANLVGTCLEQVKNTLSQLSQSPNPLSGHAILSKSYQANDPGLMAPESLESQTLLPQSTVQPLIQEPQFSEHTQVAFKQAEASVARVQEGTSQIWTSKVWSPTLVARCQRKLCEYYIGPMATLILDDIITIQQPKNLNQLIMLVAARIPDPQDSLRFRNSFSEQASSKASSKASSTPIPKSISKPTSTAKSPTPVTPDQPLFPTVSRVWPNPQASPGTPPVSKPPASTSSASTPSAHNPSASTPSPRTSFPQASPRTSFPQASPQIPASQPIPPALPQRCIDKCREQLAEFYIAPMAQMLIEDVIEMHNPTTARQFVQLIAEHIPPEAVEKFSRQVLS